MILNKFIYYAGVLVRNRKIFSLQDFLEKSQHWDLERLRHFQYEKLRGLLAQAYEKSEYYRARFDGANIKPMDIQSIDDLKRLPYLRKEELLENADKIQIEEPGQRLIYSETSGSTGKPLVFYRDRDWDAWHRASIYRGYSWHHVKPWERNGYLWGYNFDRKKRIKTRILDCLQNRFRLFSYDDVEIGVFARKLENAAYLGGYSSMIYEVAKRINRTPNSYPNIELKMVKGTSEKIFQKYQSEAQMAFGRKMISEYGSAEAGIIAFECPEGNMHVNMETAIVEVEDNQIIVTNLISRSFPVIRYKLGDYIEMDNSIRCRCGMQHPVIKEVTGRIGNIIFGYEKEYPSLTLYYVFKNLAMEHNLVLNYQVVQSEKGKLEVFLEDRFEERNEKLLDHEFTKYFGEDILVDIVGNADLKSKDKKRKDFISKISTN